MSSPEQHPEARALARDDLGWPIRIDPSNEGIDPKNKGRVCAREHCGHQEFRIDGFCSIYCRDIDEERQEIESLQRRVAALEGLVKIDDELRRAITRMHNRHYMAVDKRPVEITHDRAPIMEFFDRIDATLAEEEK